MWCCWLKLALDEARVEVVGVELVLAEVFLLLPLKPFPLLFPQTFKFSQIMLFSLFHNGLSYFLFDFWSNFNRGLKFIVSTPSVMPKIQCNMVFWTVKVRPHNEKIKCKKFLTSLNFESFAWVWIIFAGEFSGETRTIKISALEMFWDISENIIFAKLIIRLLFFTVFNYHILI